MLGFERIVEQRIREAQEKGAFDDLPGAGKPLAMEDDGRLPADLRIAHKILKNAGFIPPEMQLRKEITQTRDLLAGAEDVRERHRTLTKLNYLLAKLDAIRQTPANLSLSDSYGQKIADRISASPDPQAKETG